MPIRAGMSLEDLVAARVVAPGATVIARHKNRRYTGRITDDGLIEVAQGDAIHRGTPSATAKAIAGYEYNGWKFWKLEQDDGSVPLHRLRDALRSHG